MINVRSLNFNYRNSADVLKNISVSVERGLFYTIIGKNGCGKTTLIKNIAGLVKPNVDSCGIIISGKNVRDYSRRDLAKKLAFVSQRDTTVFDFTVYELALTGRTQYLRRFGAESKTDVEAVYSALKKTRVYDLRERSINEISGGELQRTLIARALAQNSEIMLLDEPVSSLDVNQQLSIMNTVSELCKSEKLTVICVLHDINLASRYSDGIFLLKDGELVAQGEPETVITKANLDFAYDICSEVIVNERTGRPFLMDYRV